MHGLVWLQHYFTPCFYALIAILGLLGNGLVILILLNYQNMKTIPNVYILNLAIVDFVFVLNLPLLAYQIATNNWPFGNFMCKFAGGIDTLNQYASIYTLALMSVDRLIAVVYPLSSMRYRTKKIARSLCATVWVFSGIFSIPIVILQTTTTHEGSSLTMCAILNLTDTQHYAYLFVTVICGFLLPLLIISVCYITLMFQISSSTLPISSDGSAAQRAQKRVSVLVVSVIVVFVVCWLPYYVVQFVAAFSNMTPTLAVVYTITTCWCYANSLFNPFIYTFIGENFKRNLLLMLGCARSGVRRNERNFSVKDSSGAVVLRHINHETRHANQSCMITDVTSFIDNTKTRQTYSKINPNNL